MTCRHVAQLKDTYLDGELSPSLTAEVHAHLLQCPACQEQMEMMRACEEVIAGDNDAPALDEGFASRVIASLPSKQLGEPVVATTIEFEERTRFQRVLAASWMPAMAAMLFLSVLIWPKTETEPNRGIVAPGSVVNDFGVKAVADGPINSVEEARDAMRDVRDVVSLTIGDVGKRLDDDSTEVASVVDDDKPVSFLDILFAPMDAALTPPDAKSEVQPSDVEVIRF